MRDVLPTRPVPGSAAGALTVLIVDDHRLFAEAITWPLQELGMRVVIASNQLEGMEAARLHQPDLVLMDIGLPGVSGLEVGKDIMRVVPEAKIVVLTGLHDRKVAEEAIRRGFHGYITKDIPIDRFATSILAVLDGQLVVPHHLATVFTGEQTEAERYASALATLLTARERDVLALLVEGVSSIGIAERLSISSNTVRSHIQSILPKLQVHSRLEAAAFAVRHGLQRSSASAR